MLSNTEPSVVECNVKYGPFPTQSKTIIIANIHKILPFHKQGYKRLHAFLDHSLMYSEAVLHLNPLIHVPPFGKDSLTGGISALAVMLYTRRVNDSNISGKQAYKTHFFLERLGQTTTLQTLLPVLIYKHCIDCLRC